MNPHDERYTQFIGKRYEADFCGKKISIQVIADKAVDPTFGTGALGVTPAHSKIDEEIAARHELPSVQVIGKDGLMMESAGALVSGLSTKQARAKTVEELAKRGLIVKEEDVAQALPISQRGGGVVEELPMLQWFINVNHPIASRGGKTLKQLSIEAVKGGDINIVPERFQKVYFHWMENLRDWCISRQIWFGHQIPVWYRGEEIFCGVAAPAGEGWTQDSDSLDTWFSSGLWTFSTLGWPEKTKDLEFFHPTAVLETGYDILFFWVARMILMTTYVTGTVPFKNVYLHGLVRDEQGRKMSKSLGNVIDPLETNAKFGTDATRLSLVIGSSPGNDVKLSEQKVEGFRNFANKLWNISRFVLSLEGTPTTAAPKTLADRWILSRLDQVIADTTSHLAAFRFSQAGEALRDFTWSEFADWYLEIAKVQMKSGDAGTTLAILHHVLKTVLTLWHPFMPFVTETIWQQSGFGTMLMIEAWPTVPEKGMVAKLLNMVHSDADAIEEFGKMQELITTLRNLRAEAKVPAGKRVKARIAPYEIAIAYEEIILALAMIEEITFAGEGLALDLAGLIDVAAETARLTKEIADLEKYVGIQEGKLGNADFVARAPAAIIDKEKQKLAEAKAKIVTLNAQLKTL